MNQEVAVRLAVNQLQTSSLLPSNLETTQLYDLLFSPSSPKAAQFVDDYMVAARYAQDYEFRVNAIKTGQYPTLQYDALRPYLPMPDSNTPLPKNRQEALTQIRSSLKAYIAGAADKVANTLSQQIQEQQAAVADMQSRKQKTEDAINLYNIGANYIGPGSPGAPKGDLGGMFAYSAGSHLVVPNADPALYSFSSNTDTAQAVPNEAFTQLSNAIVARTAQLNALTAQFNEVRAEQTMVSQLLTFLN